MADKVTMYITGRTQSSEDFRTAIGYINPEPLTSSDASIVAAFKADCKNFAVALNRLTTNQLLTVELQTVEDITQAGE